MQHALVKSSKHQAFKRPIALWSDYMDIIDREISKSKLKLSALNAVKHAHSLRAAINLVLISAFLSLFSAAHAKDYIVEVIVFENMSNSTVTEPHAYQAPKQPRTNAQAWILDTQLLNEQAQTIANSSDFLLRHHFAWGQESLPYSKSATYSVVETDTKGFIKIYADSLLFANLDLDYKGFRMIEKRRLKLNEKHYFDHPKFGILLQVSRLEEVEPVLDATAETIEPTVTEN